MRKDNEMKKLEGKQKHIEYALLAGVFLILCFFLYRYTVYTLDSDASSELALARQLADEGAVLTKNWLYGSELRVFYSQLIFAPLFALFDNWGTVRMIGTALMLFGLLFGFYFFCREADCRHCFPLGAVLMLLPLSRIYFDVLLKFTYYLPHAIMGFLIPAMVLRYTRKRAALAGRRGYAPLAAGMLLSFAVSLNGMRMLLTVFFPLLLSALLLLWLNGATPTARKLLAGNTAVTVSALMGCAVNALFLSKAYSVLDVTGISFKSFSLSGIEKVLGGLINAYGYRPGEDVFSVSLLYSAQGGLLFVLSVCAAVLILLRRGSFRMGQQFVAGYYLSSLAALCLLYSLTDMTFTGRYMVQTAVLGLLPILVCFHQKEIFGKAGRSVVLGVTCFALLCGALHYNDMRKEDKTRAQRECAQFLVDNGYTQGYASFWNGNVMTELSNGVLDIWVWDEKCAELKDPDEIVPFLQSKAHTSPPPDGRVFVLLSANEDYYCGFAQNFSADNIVFKTANYELGALHEYIVYGFDSYDELRGQFC